MNQPHKHRLLIRPLDKRNRNVLFFACSDCAYRAWYEKTYFYNTFWKEGIRYD